MYLYRRWIDLFFFFFVFSVNWLLTRIMCENFWMFFFLLLFSSIWQSIFNSLPRHYIIKAYWLLCHPLWHFSHHHRRQHIRASTKFACRSCWMRSQLKHAILHFHFFFFLYVCVCYTESRTFQRKLRKFLFKQFSYVIILLRTYE